MHQFSVDEWLEWRRAGVTGTDASIIMKALPEEWGTIGGLWLEKTGRPTPKREQTYRMKRGRELEPVAREAYEKMTGIPMPAVCIERTDHPILRVSLDGINDQAGRALEIKCPGAVDHEIAVQGAIPDKYLWQCVHILMVTELPVLDYFSFDGKNGIIVEFRRNARLEKTLLTRETRFWSHVIRDVAPPKDAEPKRLVNGMRDPFTVRKTRARVAHKSRVSEAQNVLQFGSKR